ncbi:MAG: type II toxin-antitoxin system Phd/YefM family antitoxin [Verrucomicrobiota bacterium]|jgi:prevent-host-death family protein
MKTITTHDAKTHLSRYLAEVEEGGRITIARGKKPVAMLVPITSLKKQVRPKVGSIKGPRYEFPDIAFRALNEEELKEWGL